MIVTIVVALDSEGRVRAAADGLVDLNRVRFQVTLDRTFLEYHVQVTVRRHVHLRVRFVCFTQAAYLRLSRGRQRLRHAGRLVEVVLLRRRVDVVQCRIAHAAARPPLQAEHFVGRSAVRALVQILAVVDVRVRSEIISRVHAVELAAAEHVVRPRYSQCVARGAQRLGLRGGHVLVEFVGEIRSACRCAGGGVLLHQWVAVNVALIAASALIVPLRLS